MVCSTPHQRLGWEAGGLPVAAPGFGSAAGLSRQTRGYLLPAPSAGTMCSVSVCGEGKTGEGPSRGQSSGLLPGEAEWEPENPASIG